MVMTMSMCKAFVRQLAVLALGGIVAGCGANGGQGSGVQGLASDARGTALDQPINLVQRAPVTFAESAKMEVARQDVERAMRRFFINRRVDPVHYRMAGADLDGDGTAEALVHLTGDTFCAITGCDMLVLKRVGRQFQTFAEIKRVQAPIVVSHRSTLGWRDMYVRTGGGGMRSMTVALQFSANGYPPNASVLTAFLGDGRANGETLIDATTETPEPARPTAALGTTTLSESSKAAGLAIVGAQ